MAPSIPITPYIPHHPAAPQTPSSMGVSHWNSRTNMAEHVRLQILIPSWDLPTTWIASKDSSIFFQISRKKLNTICRSLLRKMSNSWNIWLIIYSNYIIFEFILLYYYLYYYYIEFIFEVRNPSTSDMSNLSFSFSRC